MSKKRIVKGYGKYWLAYVGKNHNGYYTTCIPSITVLSLQALKQAGLKRDLKGLVDLNS